MASQGDEEEVQGIPKSESDASLLIGERISSRETSPSSDENPTHSPAAQNTKDEPAKVTTVNMEEEEPPQVNVGKPPRPDLLKPRPSPVSRHTSKDGSIVSNLSTEEANVSWENDDPGLAMPMFGAMVDTANPVAPMSPTSIDDAPPPKQRRAKQNWGKLRKSLGVDEISVKEVNPLETEAEAAILRVVDKTRRANATKAGNILPHVSNEAADALTQDAVATAEQGNLTNNRKISFDEKSVRSRDTTATAAGKAKGHHRTTTLDHQLFNLANQLDTLQNGAEGGRERAYTADNDGGRGRFFSEDVVIPEQKGNSGDVLAQNAAVLFRRPIAAKKASKRDVTAEEERPPPSPPSSSPPSTLSARKLMTLSSITAPSMGVGKKTDAEESATRPVDSIVVEDAVDIETGVDVEVAPGGDSRPTPSGNGGRKHFKFEKGARRLAQATNQEVKEDFDTFWKFLQPRGGSIKFYLLFVVCCLIIPLIMTSAILFNYTENPDLGREGASWSWFLLFLARNIITGTLAKATEVIVIDLLCLHYRLTARLFGTIFTLLLVQSKGWPFIVFSWALYNFALNSGDNPFAHHWLYWQDALPLFNDSNPSGTITYSHANYVVNGIAVSLGFVVAVKRLWWGLYLGKRSYRHYGDELAKVIKDMVMVSKVAAWSKDIEKHGKRVFKKKGFKAAVGADALSSLRVAELSPSEDNEDELVDVMNPTDGEGGKVIDEDNVNLLTGSLTRSQSMRIDELLGRWEEPELVGADEQENISIASILQFRQMLAYMDDDYPFSLCFGPADSRVACVESAQSVYERLLSLTPGETLLPFDTLAVLAKDKDGDIDCDEMKELIHLFRPERNGELSCLDFVKSCDDVYKEMRLLRASIANSGQIDHAFEVIVNIAFYAIVIIIILVALDLDPLALFVSVSGIILAFAFMIGNASSRYFEGILFILVRRPYDIGDRIAISNPEKDLSKDGSATWFVQTVGLFSTTVRYAATNEVATVANGSLASTRVINAKRSPRANCYVYMKFSVDIPYTKVLIFRKAVEAFIKERPREWVALNGFRATRVEPDAGYIEYIIALGHRSSWQDVGTILQSKADVASYCLELAKKLNMRYIAPPLPVNLSMAAQSNMQLVNIDPKLGAPAAGISSPTPSSPGVPSVSSPDVRSIAALFKHE